MSTPRFSVVIPTRQRHQTLPSAITSVLAQDYADFELIVMDNASTPETREVVQSFNSQKIKYDRAPETLPMNRNWERGLRLCEGDFVFFLGDDDALMPDCFSIAARMLDRAPLDVLSWNKYTYWWENALEETLRGRMFLHFQWDFQMLDMNQLLSAYYGWQIGFDMLPSIYSGFVKRSLIDRVKAATGDYFLAGSPDVFSGIANAYFATNVGRFERGLSISGNSGYSTGCSHFFRSKGADRRETYYRDEGKTVEQLLHPSLIPTVNLEMNLADAQIRAKEAIFPNDDRYCLKIPAMLQAMAAGINRDPLSYDATLQDIRDLAAKYGLSTSILDIPARRAPGNAPMQGLMLTPNGQPRTLAVNCHTAGVTDAAQAARLAGAILPEITIQ